MDRRSLLGGAKRQQRAQEQHEEERRWQQDPATEPAPEPDGETPADPVPPTDPVPPSETEQTPAPDLPWMPAGEPREDSAPAQSAQPEASPQRAIPWKLDLESSSQQQEPVVSDRPGAGPEAATVRHEHTASAAELATIAQGQARRRLLARWGWAALALTVALIIAVSLL